MSPTQAGDVRALVIRTSQGDVVAGVLQNAKAFRKSLENNQLWVYQPEGGRVLPYDIEVGELQELRDRDTWYEAVVAVPDTGPAPAGEAGLADRPVDRPAGNPELAGAAARAVEDSLHSEAVLKRLAHVIAERRQDMPEGSYTSYLFREGEDKIRKKTGEEAVELILARKTEDIRNEAADLIYHLLVLLEVCDIPLQDVIEVLRGRE